jgi:hypothetical protein
VRMLRFIENNCDNDDEVCHGEPSTVMTAPIDRRELADGRPGSHVKQRLHTYLPRTAALFQAATPPGEGRFLVLVCCDLVMSGLALAQSVKLTATIRR